MTLNAHVPWAVGRVEAARHGVVEFSQTGGEEAEFSLPLMNNGFVMLQSH